MKRLLLCSLLLLSFYQVFSQSENTKKESDVVVPLQKYDENTIYNFSGIEKVPEYPGGMSAFYKYIGQNFRMPTEKEFKGGKIFVSFVIEKDGSITDIVPIKYPGFGTDKEVKRVLLNSPKWKPGLQDGRNVRVSYTLPIILQSN